VDSDDLAPKRLWHLHEGDGPTVGLAVHAGHEVRPDLLPLMKMDEDARLREEDPYTDHWTLACHNQLLTRRSRFEVDLNRKPSDAICVQPEDCWNLEVWTRPVDETIVRESLAEHAAFYQTLHHLLSGLQQRHGRFVVFDFHSYNHRRDGPDAPFADARQNPDINIGTGTMDRAFWGPLVDRFMTDIGRFDFCGQQLDIRENVNFRGRYVAEYVHHYFPRTGCVLAIEVKKFFMDEWTGAVDTEQTNALLDLFRATMPGVLEELERLE
jgi:hypothetical protein